MFFLLEVCGPLKMYPSFLCKPRGSPSGKTFRLCVDTLRSYHPSAETHMLQRGADPAHWQSPSSVALRGGQGAGSSAAVVPCRLQHHAHVQQQPGFGPNLTPCLRISCRKRSVRHLGVTSCVLACRTAPEISVVCSKPQKGLGLHFR